MRLASVLQQNLEYIVKLMMTYDEIVQIIQREYQIARITS